MIADRTTDDGRRTTEDVNTKFALSVLCRLSSVLLWTDHDIRRVGMLHADDVIAGIDVMHLTGNAARHVGQKISAGLANLLDGDAAAERRIVLVPLQDVAEVADAGGGERLDRSRRDGGDAAGLHAGGGGARRHRG